MVADEIVFPNASNAANYANGVASGAREADTRASLSSQARELLHVPAPDRPGDGAPSRAKLALVLLGERGTPFGGWSKAKAQLDAASGVSGWWLHDLRRTLATGLQRLGMRLEVTEAVLNHVSGSRAGIVGIYQRHDWAAEKRAALDAWSAHLLAAAEGRLTAI